MSALALDRRHLRVSGRGRAGAARRDAGDRARRVRRAGRRLGLGQVHAPARRGGAGAALPRRHVRRPAALRRARHARARPGRAGRRRGDAVPGPRDAGRDGAPCASELAFPLENRGWSAAAVARGVEEAALALGIAPLLDRSTRELSGGELQRVGARRRARRPAARCCCSTSRHRSSTRWPATSCSACCGASTRSGGRRSSSPSTGSSAACRPPTACSRCATARSPSTASPEAFAAWAPPELQPPVTRLCALAGVPERPATVKAARAPGGADRPPLRGGQTALRTSAASAVKGSDPCRSIAACASAWYEIKDGPAILRACDLGSAPGRRSR